jgi:hypothetical protein
MSSSYDPSLSSKQNENKTPVASSNTALLETVNRRLSVVSKLSFESLSSLASLAFKTQNNQ